MKIFIVLISLLTVANCSCDFVHHSVNNDFKKIIYDNLSSLHIFDFAGMEQSLTKSWHVSSFSIQNLEFDDFEFYAGDNDTYVHELCESSNSNYRIFDFVKNKIKILIFGRSSKNTNFNFSPFHRNSIGIKLKLEKPFKVIVSTQFSFSLFLLSTFSIILYCMSRKLSKSIAFHFSCGILISLAASTMLVMFILSRVIPFRKAFYTIGIFGSSILISLFIQMKDQFWIFIENHAFGAIIYVVTVSFLTFVVMYYYYPDQINYKTINVIQLSLKFISLILLWFSLSRTVTYCLLVIIIVVLPFFHSYVICYIVYLYKYYFPTKRAYIPVEKYPNILQENTNRELENFRNYLLSPEFDTWRALKQCKNINKLAEFVDSGRHISEEEINEYSTVDIDLEESFDTDSSIEFNN